MLSLSLYEVCGYVSHNMFSSLFYEVAIIDHVNTSIKELLFVGQEKTSFLLSLCSQWNPACVIFVCKLPRLSLSTVTINATYALPMKSLISSSTNCLQPAKASEINTNIY